jgi:RNA polymerase sigma-70 factor, ECF subfamily
LIKKYLNYVYNFIFQIVKNQPDAEDLTQETFVKVWKKINKYKPEYKFKTWLFSIAKNTALDFIKKKRVITFSELDNLEKEYIFSDSIEDKSDSPLENLEKQADLNILDKAINELSPAYKTTLDLHYREGLKFREIADLLKESIDTIKTRNRRALQYMKKILTK